jgi:hypothetical protein
MNPTPANEHIAALQAAAFETPAEAEAERKAYLDALDAKYWDDVRSGTN